jgi:cytochrome c oxidase subunit 2
MFWLGLAVFVVFAVLLVAGLVRRPAEDAPDGERRLVGRWVLGGGVIMPVVVIVVVFGATVQAMREMPTDVPEGALVVDVVGHQWYYEVSYPDEGVQAVNELRIPVGRPVALRHLRRRDPQLLGAGARRQDGHAPRRRQHARARGRRAG